MTTTTGPAKPVPLHKRGEAATHAHYVQLDALMTKRYGKEGTPARDAAERVISIRRGLEDVFYLMGDIAYAYADEDWKTLGYSSWQQYCASEFGENIFPAHVLDKERRQELVAWLHDTMSVRAIAAVLGVSKSLVAKDLGGQEPPAVHKVDTSQPQLAAVDKVDTSPGPPGEATDASPQVSAPQPAKPKLSVVKGLDGKSHPASKPAAHHPTPAQKAQKTKESLAWHPGGGYAWKAAERVIDLLTTVPLGGITDPDFLTALEETLASLADAAGKLREKAKQRREKYPEQAEQQQKLLASIAKGKST